jgi:perosamine synthetase
MFRFVPPAGTPLEWRQILRALRSEVFSTGCVADSLISLARRLRIRYVFGVSSGRAALWLILKGLHRLRPDRCVVAVPAYTCFSVAASVVRAGLQLRPIDIDPETLDFDFWQLEKLPQDRILCVVTSNLFGLVNDLPRIRQVALEKGAFVLDDAAQALGATRGGHLAGTAGDVGLYSLGRGKAIGAVRGGLIVTDSEDIACSIQSQMQHLPLPSFFHTASLLLQLMGTSVLLNPRVYWIPNSLPFLKLGVTEFDPSFPAESMPDLSKGLLLGMIDQLAGMNHIRRKNAVMISESLAGNSNFTTPAPAFDCQPTYIRFPVLAKDESTRRRALARLLRIGIGASAFYPSAICDIPGILPHMASSDFHCSVAENLSRRLLTLPTHPLVCPSDLERMAAILADGNDLKAVAAREGPCT